MPRLSEHFLHSGYSVHRLALRLQRLPPCCRGNLTDCGLCIKHLDRGGSEITLPLQKCRMCGRHYALCDGKYLPVDNPLQYDCIPL